VSFDMNPRDDEPADREEYEAWEHEQAKKRRVPGDGTAQDPLHPAEPTEYFQPGDGPSTTVMIALIAIIILVAAAYMALITNAGGDAP
jgi:hypothetical protein